jgi:hypothetical protein
MGGEEKEERIALRSSGGASCRREAAALSGDI